MKLSIVFLFGIAAAASQAETLCGKNEAAPAGEVCVVRGQFATESVQLIGSSATLTYKVTEEDDVHSGGRVSELSLSDDKGGTGSAVVNWEERWVEGYSPAGASFSAKNLTERPRH